MTSDARLLFAIFGALTTLVALPFAIDFVRDNRRAARDSLRPVLVEARVVTATGSDPVYRSGHRQVPLGDVAKAAVAIRVTRKGGPDQWLFPAALLMIDGDKIDHLQTSRWPEDDRQLRVLWFSVESSSRGGTLSVEDAAERLAYRPFLAPEMGQGLQAGRLPEVHNDDRVWGRSCLAVRWGMGRIFLPVDVGTTRLYAQIEVVDDLDSERPLQVVTTLGVDKILDPTFPTLYRPARFAKNIHPATAELLNLPGFEPQGETSEERDAVTSLAFGRSFTQMVDARLVVSSWTLVSTAIAGVPNLTISDLDNLGRIRMGNKSCTKGGRPLGWGDDVRAGDVLSHDGKWMVLLGDRGDSTLDPWDVVLYSRGQPPKETTILAVTRSDAATLEHWRFSRDCLSPETGRDWN